MHPLTAFTVALCALTGLTTGDEMPGVPQEPVNAEQALQLLKQVQTSTSQLEARLSLEVGSVVEGMRQQMEGDSAAFGIQLDRLVVLIDEAIALDAKSKLTSVYTWLVDEIEKSSDLDLDLRGARQKVLRSRLNTLQLRRRWQRIKGTLVPEPDLYSDSIRRGVLSQAQQFDASLDVLRHTIELINDATILLQNHIESP